MDFFRRIFETEGFPPRWQCGTWTQGHGWLHIISDLLIFGAYFAIPLALLFFLKKRRQEIPFPKIVALFGAFILACGFTHLIDASMFFEPRYRLLGVVKLITAIVSWWTVFMLIGILPKALQLPGMSDMNRKLERRNSALERMGRMLKNRNTELSSFAAVVSHDIKAPIASSVMFAALAREASEKGKTEDCEKMLGELEGTLQSAARMIDEVHEFAKVGDEDLSLGEVDLNEVLKTVQQSLAGLIVEEGASLEIAPGFPRVVGNQGALVRVFSNLLQNAIKYRDPGRAPKIVIRWSTPFEEENERIQIRVEDNGRGIDEANLERIFQPFTRVDQQIDVPGSGLGLAVSRRIVDRLSGEITVESRLGNGSVFCVDLSLAD